MDFRYLLNKQLTGVLNALPEDFNVLAMALESTNSGVVITDYRQPDNPIVYCNHAFENMTGYSREEVIGKNCRFLQENDREQKSVALLRDCIANGVHATVELRNYHKNGTMFWSEISIAPVRDSDGNVSHFIGIQNDVTRKKKTETELREQIDQLNRRLEKQNRYMNNLESTLANILQTSMECLVVLDSDMKVVKANPNFYHLFKETEEKVIGNAFADIQNGQWNNEELLSLLSATLNKGMRFNNYELKLSLPNEHCETVNLKARPLQIAGINKEFVLLVINCIGSTKTNMQTVY